MGPSDADLERARREFAELGYARFGVVFDDAHLEELRARTDQIMLGEVVYDGLFFQHDSESGRYEDLQHKRGYVGPSLNYRKLEKLEKDALFWAHIGHPAIERIVRTFIKGAVTIYRAVLFNKSARGGSPLPWHQDTGLHWGVDRYPFLQVWTAIDDCPPEAGCLEVLPKSHLDGPATELGGLIPERLHDGRQADAVALPARAGEVMLVHNMLWHRTAINRTGRPRRTLSVCYMTAETRCLRKKRAPRQFVRVFDAI